ncbi:MAG: ABC transporter substrate-binding protein [Anaerolineales bacterium]|nr:ABC transporter substrate-binding protein [Anaerolineales bacterium]
MRNNLRVFVIITILGLIISACGGGASTANTGGPVTSAPDATDAAVLHIGWLGVPDTLNPAYAFLTEAYSIFDLVYSPLVTESPSGEYVGALAKEWSASDDHLTWTFALKDGLKWHNGEDFTADQMAWAINAVIADPDGWAALSGYVDGFSEATAPDAKTVQIVTEYPIANMEYRLSFLYAVYPPDFESFASPEELQNFVNDHPIGTGAFKMNAFDKDRGVLILDANKEYVDGAPFLDQVIFQKFDAADAMIQALKAGDIDLVLGIPASAYETVKNFQGVKAVAFEGRGFDELIINDTSEDNDPPSTGNPALKDPAVRLALETATNRQDLIDIVLQSLGKPGSTIVPPTLGGGFWHNPEIKPVEFDIAKANQILDEAGYIMGADGVRVKDGVRLEFRLQFDAESSNYPRIADLLSDWYKQIGVKATPQGMDADTLIAAMTAVGDYDLVIWGWVADPDPDFILGVMLSDQYTPGGWNDSGYHNPAYDALYKKQQSAIDKNERQEFVYEMQEMVYNDRPYIVLYYDVALQAYRSDRFTNFIESPLGIEISASLAQVKPVDK